MIICVRKSNGAFLEAQSKPTAGTLINNMVRAGYSEEDLEEKEVTEAEFQAIIAALPENITAKAAAVQHQLDIVDSLPSWKQVSDAIEAATTIAALKAIVKKMARVVYWLAKNKVD